MATIHLIEENEASPQVKQIYDDIKKTLGLDFVPNAFKAAAWEPDNLQVQWEGYKQAEQVFGRELLTALSLAVDVTNACGYAVEFDTALLRQLGYDDAKIEAIVNYISGNSYFNRYIQGLNLEPDPEFANVGRTAAAMR